MVEVELLRAVAATARARRRRLLPAAARLDDERCRHQPCGRGSLLSDFRWWRWRRRDASLHGHRRRRRRWGREHRRARHAYRPARADAREARDERREPSALLAAVLAPSSTVWRSCPRTGACQQRVSVVAAAARGVAREGGEEALALLLAFLAHGAVGACGGAGEGRVVHRRAAAAPARHRVRHRRVRVERVPLCVCIGVKRVCEATVRGDRM